MATETASTPAPAADKTSHTRPTKPDENVFKEELAKAEKEHKGSMDQLVWLYPFRDDENISFMIFDMVSASPHDLH